MNRLAAFALHPEQTDEKRGYAWRVALTVVDALAEFGAENTALFAHDDRLQSLVGSVLRRFADADLQSADTWSETLRRVLSATLNGARHTRPSWATWNWAAASTRPFAFRSRRIGCFNSGQPWPNAAISFASMGLGPLGRSVAGCEAPPSGLGK